MKLIKLRDTRGNFSMGIKLPTKDYKPNNEPLTVLKKAQKASEPSLLTKSEINKRYRLRHPDRYKESKRKWSLKNKGYSTKYYHLHREYLSKKRMERYYRDKNKEGHNIRKHGSSKREVK